MTNRAGHFRINLSGEAAYKSFVPHPLPPVPALAMDEPLIYALIDANKRLASLNSVSSGIPNMDLFVSMCVRKEALLSSQIEETQAKDSVCERPDNAVNISSSA